MKAKQKFKIKEMRNKGITLIALAITIIVLLILASITIGAISGDNGILNNAGKAKEDTEISQEKEIIQTAAVQSMGNNKRGNLERDEFEKELNKQSKQTGTIEVSDIGEEFEVFFTESERYYEVDKDGNVTQIITEENTAETPIYWEKTTKTDEEWYSYADISNGNEEVKVNEPKLRGAMTPIKYVGEDAESQTGSKWANAITQDGSMWVWIPRYAYKITSGYHEAGTDTTGGTIEIAFIDTENNFLNGETGILVTDPSEVTYTNNVQNEWLVHPAFTSNAENGGGFGELTGIWVGKFETTGSYDSATGIRTVTILPGKRNDLGNMTINEMYKLAKSTTFEENMTLNSHMAKNSEWGAIAYLTQSKYGVNGKEIEVNANSGATGGSNNEKTIYVANKGQSTTNNAYGVYDMKGGLWEAVASYVNYTRENDVWSNGGYGEKESLVGENEIEKATSTAYKTVYEAANNTNQIDSYNLTEKRKGDAIWEISSTQGGFTGIWFNGYNNFAVWTYIFFIRGGNYYKIDHANIFAFNYYLGDGTGATFRSILTF